MKTVMTIWILAVLVLPAWAERPQLRGSEAPRATDLLRAEKLAEQARKRLELPRKRGGGWVRGGARWGEERPPEERAPVFIDVHPGRSGRPRSSD